MPPMPTPPPRPGLWQAWTAWQLMIWGLLLLMANMFWQAVVFSATGSLFAAIAVAGLLAIVAPCIGAARWHGQTLASAFDLRGRRVDIVVGLVAGALIWLPVSALAALSSRLHPPSPEHIEFLQQHLPTDAPAIALAFLAACVVVPVAEELVFRGLLYRAARGRWGVVAAAVLTSLFFGVAHLEPWSLFGLVATGLALCAVYEVTGSLWAPIGAHAVHNAVSLTLMLRWRDDLGHETSTGPIIWPIALVCVVLLAWLLRWVASPRPDRD